MHVVPADVRSEGCDWRSYPSVGSRNRSVGVQCGKGAGGRWRQGDEAARHPKARESAYKCGSGETAEENAPRGTLRAGSGFEEGGVEGDRKAAGGSG